MYIVPLSFRSFIVFIVFTVSYISHKSSYSVLLELSHYFYGLPLLILATMTTSIGEEINAATRSLHTPLNRRILVLLPLALPPKTLTPTLYGYGLSHFLPIYHTFEFCFRSILNSPSTPSRAGTFLRKLYIPELERTQKLRADLTKLLGCKITAGMEIGGPWRQQQSFMTHIRTSTNEKPHLLIAYTWILYMALFSGGRHIRARLLSAGPKFWGVEEEDPPLSFWTFPSSTDGEDLKTLYKAQVLELSTSLTELERKEIVAEGVEIMSTMLKLVDEVDELSNPYKLTPRGRELSLPEEQTPPLLKRLSNLFK